MTFRELHTGSFVMPNAWDAGSAVILAEAGFPAIADHERRDRVLAGEG